MTASAAFVGIGGVRVSHPDKVYWPEQGYTKPDLVRYYAETFERLAPYVKGRLLSLERCPDGMRGSCFFQKEKPKGLPPSGAPESSRREIIPAPRSLSNQGFAVLREGHIAKNSRCRRARADL